VFCGPKWAAPPLVLARICKNQQAKACWKCCKMYKTTQKIYVSENINFYYKNLNVKYDFMPISELKNNHKSPKNDRS
jgi:hypothetical protein